MDRDDIPASYVYRGTGAGWKRENPKPTEEWECECLVPKVAGHPTRRMRKPYLKNCPDCWARRPY